MINFRLIWYVVLVFTMTLPLLTGCKKGRDQVDEVANSVVIQSQQKAGKLKLRKDLQTINRSIQLFHANHGRYPESLEELAKKGIISRIPREPFGGEWNYDPMTGIVTSSSFPEYNDSFDWDGAL